VRPVAPEIKRAPATRRVFFMISTSERRFLGYSNGALAFYRDMKFNMLESSCTICPKIFSSYACLMGWMGYPRESQKRYGIALSISATPTWSDVNTPSIK